MKNKRFKDTRVGKLAGGLAKGITKSIPVVGDLVENITSQDGGEGVIDYQKMVSQVIRLVTFGILVWQFVKGNIPFENLLNY